MTGSNFKFIIIGAGRGGTSLLTGLLDYHSQLELLTEYGSISHLMGRAFKCNDEIIIPEHITSFIRLCKEKVRPPIKSGETRSLQSSYMHWKNIMLKTQMGRKCI